MGAMRETQFLKLVTDEFGQQYGQWIVRSHVLSRWGQTAAELMEGQGTDLRDIWWHLCADFDVPAERQLGVDD